MLPRSSKHWNIRSGLSAVSQHYVYYVLEKFSHALDNNIVMHCIATWRLPIWYWWRIRMRWRCWRHAEATWWNVSVVLLTSRDTDLLSGCCCCCSVNKHSSARRCTWTRVDTTATIRCDALWGLDLIRRVRRYGNWSEDGAKGATKMQERKMRKPCTK